MGDQDCFPLPVVVVEKLKALRVLQVAAVDFLAALIVVPNSLVERLSLAFVCVADVIAVLIDVGIDKMRQTSCSILISVLVIGAAIQAEQQVVQVHID